MTRESGQREDTTPLKPLTTDADFWRSANVDTGFEKVPLHCYVYLFHLEWHRNIWVHVQHMTEYRYQPELRDKLVLPNHHRDLIDILTSKMSVFVQDFVPGKSGGTTILCQGAPGLGKTLTAEIYSEVVGKPLYRVHSGQLGTTAASVGATLSGILRRAARWDAILLLDEADVYIRRRDNDLQHNAIVAEFLRTLEYFNGLLFMTTNRIDDVDDAILSRCIAKIQYETPPKPDARAIRLWKLVAEQSGADLTDDLIEALTSAYPKASGHERSKELPEAYDCSGRAKRVPLSEDYLQDVCVVSRARVTGACVTERTEMGAQGMPLRHKLRWRRLHYATPGERGGLAMNREQELAIVRRAFAKQIVASVGLDNPGLEAAFAAVERERYLGPGPWLVGALHRLTR